MSYISTAPPPYEASVETPYPATDHMPHPHDPLPVKQDNNPSKEVPPHPAVPDTIVINQPPTALVSSTPQYPQHGPATVIVTEQQREPTTTVVLPEPPKPNQIFTDRPATLPDGKQTVLQYKNGLLTFMAAFFICFFTLECCCCCFALIPFCLNITKDVVHVHPDTGEVVGYYRRLF